MLSPLNIRVGFYLALRQIRRASRWTTGLIVFIMLLTFLNLVAVYGILVGLAQGVANSYRSQYTGDIIISSLDTRNYVERSSDIIALLQTLPQVDRVSPRYVLVGTLEANYKDKVSLFDRPNMTSVKFVGIDPRLEDQFSGLASKVVEGSYLAADDQDEILVGSQYIQKYTFGVLPNIVVLKAVQPGTRVRIDMGGVTREVAVKGIIKSKVTELSARVYLPMDDFRRLVGRTDYNVGEISILLKPGVDPEVFRQALLKDGVGAYAKVQTAPEARPGVISDFSKTLSLLGNGFGSLGLVVASVTIFIVIFINALTRRKYIGILKGIGISGEAIQVSYVFQSMFYAVCGSVLGLTMLYGLLVPYVAVHPTNFPVADGILYAPVPETLVRMFLLVVATIIAGYIPSRMIVRSNTLDSILGRK